MLIGFPVLLLSYLKRVSSAPSPIFSNNALVNSKLCVVRYSNKNSSHRLVLKWNTESVKYYSIVTKYIRGTSKSGLLDFQDVWNHFGHSEWDCNSNIKPTCLILTVGLAFERPSVDIRSKMDSYSGFSCSEEIGNIILNKKSGINSLMQIWRLRLSLI